MEFPRLVYQGTKGKEFKHVLVESPDEYGAKLAAGWHGSVPEALSTLSGAAAAGNAVRLPGSGEGGKAAGDSGDNDKTLPTRAEMETMAKKLNIKGNIKGMKGETLLAKIEEALKPKE